MSLKTEYQLPLSVYIGYIPKNKDTIAMECTIKNLFIKLFNCTDGNNMTTKITNILKNKVQLENYSDFLDILTEGVFNYDIIKAIDLVDKKDVKTGKMFWMCFIHFNLTLDNILSNISYINSKLLQIKNKFNKSDNTVQEKNNFDKQISYIVKHYQLTQNIFQTLKDDKESYIYYTIVPSGKGYLEHIKDVHQINWIHTNKNIQRFFKIRAYYNMDQSSVSNHTYVMTDEEENMLNQLLENDTTMTDEEYADMEEEYDWIENALTNMHIDQLKKLEECDRVERIFNCWVKQLLENQTNIPNTSQLNNQNILYNKSVAKWNVQESFLTNFNKGYYSLDDMMLIMSNMNHMPNKLPTHISKPINLSESKSKKIYPSLIIPDPNNQLSICPGMGKNFVNKLSTL